jgi:exopolysaccharide biosynthesis polyprenyl glycosylphosphotransferase
MFALRRRILLKSFKVFDLLVMVFAFGLATLAVQYQTSGIPLTELIEMRIKVQNFALFIGLLLAWHLVFSLFGLYHSRRFSSRGEEVRDVVKATTLGTLAILAAAFLVPISLINTVFLSVFWAVSTLTTILSRLALRFVLVKLRLQGRNLHHMLIVGTNPRALKFARNIEAKPELGYRILGFVDDDYGKNGVFKNSGYPLVAGFNEFPSYLREHVVDEVCIHLPLKSRYDQASRIVAQCQEQGVIVRFLSNIFNVKAGQSEAGHFDEAAVITLSTGAMQGLPVLLKRALDFSLSLIFLIILSPLFLVAAALIKLTSPGPVFFIHDRVGLNKRRFPLVKFRTMIPNAEEKMAELEERNEVSGPVFKIKNDPRITKIGKFLRKTSIDELPQLWNVLKGDMSIVGPRPLPVRDYNGFDEDWHRRRFSVRPGITCLWQINGRSNVSFDKWMELDMEYIDKWSLGLDLMILLKTVPAVFKGSGAA